MERYENLGLVGEGSYGMVLKCRHRETGCIVAIKKFIESEDDKMVKKIAIREIKMLKQLRHENLVNLLEVFRRKRRLFLVFEFVERTVLDDLERYPDGLHEMSVKRISFQVLRGLEFCHSLSIIHRDVKPENILISKSGVVKLCDFGFARTLATGPGEVFTEYVATRWYRAPELLVGDVNYGKAVDIWAVGCLIYEMITGDPLFPGDSDIDQLFHITKTLGNLTQRHAEVFYRNPLFHGMRLPSNKHHESIGNRFAGLSQTATDLIVKSLSMDASQRLSCLQLMKHPYYQENHFAQNFLEALKHKIEKETVANPLLKSLAAHKSMKLHNSQNDSRENKMNKFSEGKCNSKDSVLKLHEKKKGLDGGRRNENRERGGQVKSHHQQQYERNEHAGKQQIIAESVKVNFASDKMTNKKSKPLPTSSSLTTTTTTAPTATTTTKSKQKHDTKNITSKVADDETHQTYITFSSCLQKQDSEITEILKNTSRTPLDLSINQPGKNLPQINSTPNSSGKGYETTKKKKLVLKKALPRAERDEMLCTVSEKSPFHLENPPFHLENSKSIEEISRGDKYKRNNSKICDSSDTELPKVSGFTLPVVKGAQLKNKKSSPSRGSKRVSLTSTIPHIQNIDLFTSGSNSPSKEASRGSNRSHRDGNLPAV